MRSMRYSVIEHPQFSERSTSKFFSSADRRRVTVDHLLDALFGFLPLGFRPLTAPLPTVHDRLRLLDGVVASALDDVQHGREPPTVTRTSPHVLALEQGSVEPAASRALVLPTHQQLVHEGKLPQISPRPRATNQRGRTKNLFFAGSFRIPGILSPGDRVHQSPGDGELGTSLTIIGDIIRRACRR
jgi:hypothetical protein